MGDGDTMYLHLLGKLLAHGEPVVTRNSPVRRLVVENATFRTAPLVGVRKTAWRNALREMEWFLSGSNNVDDLHPSVRHWWQPFCRIDKTTLPHNYGEAFRRIYAPGLGHPVEVQPSRKEADEPVVVPFWPRRDVADGTAKHLGYDGVNCHGDRFRVVDYVGGSFYLVQFESNGYVARSRPANFHRGVVKNPYYPTVLGVGCYGVTDKDSVTYYARAYQTWSGMMNRCYNTSRRHYKWYGARGVTVAGRWKCFEYFLTDLPGITGFAEWLTSPGHYHLDKDYRKANYYGPDVCVFLPGGQNTALAAAEKFYPVPRRELVIDQVAELIDGIKNHPYSRRNCVTTWIPHHVAAGLVNPTNCHGSWIQAFVGAGDQLGLWMCQRSVDVVCGLPHNWIQYWALLLWLARRTGRTPGALHWTGGDVHLYDEHRSLAGRMVAAAAQVRATPGLTYSPSSESFRANDFSLDGEYQPLIVEGARMIV